MAAGRLLRQISRLQTVSKLRCNVVYDYFKVLCGTPALHCQVQDMPWSQPNAPPCADVQYPPSSSPQSTALFADGTAVVGPAIKCTGYCEHPDLRVYSLGTSRLGSLQYLGINTQRGIAYDGKVIDGEPLEVIDA